MIEQLALGVDVGLCDYGTPKLGENRPCSKPVTHAACWWQKAGKPYYGEILPELSGRIECCRDHAHYYADSWAYPIGLYPGLWPMTVWIEILR